MVAVKRRQQNPLLDPPPRLLAFNPADWLPLVDPSGYNPEMYRNRGLNGPYGEPSMSLQDWQHQQARSLWGRARLAWFEEHGGWPGALSPLDLLREEVAARRAFAREQYESDPPRRLAARRARRALGTNWRVPGDAAR